MYSRAGKGFEKKFKILMSKKQILSQDTAEIEEGERGPSRLRKYYRGLSDSQQLKKEGKSKKSYILHSAKKERSFFNIPETPAPGYYNCNYSYVFKSPTSFKFKEVTKRNYLKPCHQVDRFNSDLKIRKIPSVSFIKQLPRNEQLVGELNENRFLSFNVMPEACSKYKSKNSPDISKYSNRKDVFASKEHLPSYDPGYSFVKEDLGVVRKFSRYLSRRPLFQSADSIREHYNR